MLDMKKIVQLINSLGYKTYTFDYSIYSQYVLNCYNWYKGKTPYHVVKRYNGNSDVTIEKAKLHMGKRVCEDLASLVCNENMIISIEDSKEKEFILGNDEMSGVLGDNDFFNQFNKCYELSCGLGTGAMEIVLENLLSVEDKLVASKNTKIKLVRYDALHILPLQWNNCGDIIEVAFLDEYKVGDDTVLELRLHVKDENGNYVIVNRKCKVNTFNANNTLNDFIYLDNNSMISEFNTGSDRPWFTCIRMPQINSYDINSPMGASAFGDAIDELKSIDDAFNTLCGEFRYSNKKVFYSKSLLSRDSNGNVVIPDDDESNKQVFYFTGDDYKDDTGKEPIKEYNPSIRSKELSEGIELVLDILSFKCGLGHGYYKFSNGTVQKTAREVISANSDLYRNVCKMQIAIEKNIYSIIRGLLYVSNYIFGTGFNVDCKMAVNFDASLIEDKAAERERALKEVDLGLLTKNEYRAMYYPDLGDIVEDNTDEEKIDVTKDII